MNGIRFQIQCPDFKLEHFVRPTALQWFHDQFTRWLDAWRWSGKTRIMVLGFTGPHGIGKTWLLKYLEQADDELKPLTPFFYDVEDLECVSNTAKIRHDVNKQLPRLEGKGPVLLLDNVPPPPLREPLKTFEYDVLRPCAEAGACIVMTLVEETRVCWYATYLKAFEMHSLELFSLAQTQAQLRKLESRRKTVTVYNRSGGLPYLNYLVDSNRDQSFDIFLSYWLHRIPSSEHELIQHCLAIACVLDSIEDAKINKVKDLLPPLFSMHAFEIRNVLKKHGLTETSNGKGPLVLRYAIKEATQNHLRKEAPSLYGALMKAIQK